MKKYLIITLCIVLASCVNKNPQITFISESDESIDSVKIATGKICPALVFKDIKKETEYNGSIQFCEAMQGDGSYFVEVFRKGKVDLRQGFGYFTNGSSLDGGFKITVGKMGSINVEEY